MKISVLLTTAAFSLALAGCAISSGLQTYNLPKEQGESVTPQGVHLNLVTLTQDNISQFNTRQRAAIAASNQDVRQLFRTPHYEYRLNPSDVLSVQLWAYPEITPPATAATSGYTIDSQGYIYLPLIGKTKVAGKSVGEISTQLRSQYARYLKTPDVTVRIMSYQGQRYAVNGAVLKGGQFNLSDQPVSLYTALSMAGGINPETGDSSQIQLIRDGRTYNLNVRLLEQAGLSLHKLLIKPNDTIFVNSRENQKLYVLGESNKPTALTLREQGMTLSDVIGEAEGINPYSASAARIYVLRTNTATQQSNVYQLDLSNIANFALANQFAMQRNDIVYVDATGLARWQRILNQLVPFSNALSNVKSLGQ